MTQLLQNAAYGTALILAAAALRRVLKGRLVPGARLALWAVCLFRLLTPAAPQSVLSLWRLFSSLAPVSQPSSPAYSTLSYLPPAAEAFVPQIMEPGTSPDLYLKPAPFPWEKVLPAVWLAVGIALAARYVLAYVRTRRAVACTIPVEGGDPRYASLPKCARLREGPMEGAPLTFGVVRPTVVLSPGLEGAALDCVLAHEGVHARRRDNLWHYAMAAALTVFWWNPAVWLMARLLRRDIELSCDRAAVKRLGADKRAEYAETLISMATQGEGPAFCQAFGRKAAEERILSVMKFKRTSVIGVVLSLALVLAVTAAFASNPAADVPGEDSTASSAPASADNSSNLSEIIVAQLRAHIYDVITDYMLTKTGSAACGVDGCTISGKHHHEDGGAVGTTGYPLCLDPDCGVTDSHAHINGQVVKVDYQDPYTGSTQPPSVIPVPIAACTVSGCTVQGEHEHNGVTYACNGAHSGGVCDGNHHTGSTPSSGTHHSESHGSGSHHSGGHH